MAWRSVVIAHPAALSSKAEASLSRCTVLAAIEATVISLQQIVLQHGESHQLVLPVIEAN